MKGLFGHIADIKKIRSRQCVAISIEIPVEHYAQAVALLDEKDVLVTLSDLKMPYGVVEGRSEPEEEPEPPRQKGGPLSKLAAMMCQSSACRMWMAGEFAYHALDESEARDLMCSICNVESRAQLDHDESAKAIFNEKFRHPWQNYNERLSA